MPRSHAIFATAHHEAGHAVVAWAERVAIGRFTIRPEGDWHGFVRHAPIMGRLDPSSERSTQVRLRGERLIRISLAGPISQQRFSPRSWRRYHGESDYRRAADMLRHLVQSDEQFTAYMRLLRVEAERLVDLHWDLIEAFAQELVTRTTLIGSQVREFIDQFYSEYSSPQPGMKN
jgi:hypothetical protein